MIGFVITNQYQGWQSVSIGALEMPENGNESIRSLVNRTPSVGASNYDSLDFPRGTTFTVPTGQEFVMTGLQEGVAADTDIVVGYGDNAVADSGSAPTNAVTLWAQDIGGQEVNPIPVWLVIPEGKVLFVHASDNMWNMSAVGFLRDAE